MSSDPDAVSISAAAALFGLSPSTLRWWEHEGVLPEPGRRGGRRSYDRRELRRVGLAYLCCVIGTMPLARAAAVVCGRSGHAGWQAEVGGEVARLGREIRRLEAARDHLRHLLSCTDADPAADCPYLEDVLAAHTPRGRVPVRDLLDAASAARPRPRDGSGSFRHTDVRPRCVGCGGVLPARGRGRPRRHCSAACRQRAHRRRSAAG